MHEYPGGSLSASCTASPEQAKLVPGGTEQAELGESSHGLRSASGHGDESSRSALPAACAAFLIWGFLPVFWKSLASVDAFQVLCHRIVWSFAALLPCMFFSGRLGTLAVFLRVPRNALGLACSGFLLAGNWYLYIWAIRSDMVVEASLGYYINPLVNILFGVTVFHEKASRTAWAAVGIALLGVLYQICTLGHLPFVPLGLAFSFAIYTLLRKKLVVQALPGLFAETLFILPLALGYLLWQEHAGEGIFLAGNLFVDALLIGAGLVTTVPLVLFAYGARRLRMTSLGILQYINPTCVFLLGVFVYGEPFTGNDLVVFFCIWAALALYTWDMLRRKRW